MRGWFLGAILGSASIAWLAVGFGASEYLLFMRPLSVAAVGLVVGSLEAAYLSWTLWGIADKLVSSGVTALAVLGSALITGSTVGGVVAADLAVVASGLGLIGFGIAVGVWGVFKSAVRTTAKTATGLIIAAAVAYFASLIWTAVP